MATHWVELAACALVIAFAGSQLTHLADAIGEKTGMSASWVGMLMLAAVTSLPELATGISAVSSADAPDIAVGNLLGSAVFNLALLVFLDILHRPDSIYSQASTVHILTAGFGVILLSVVGASVLLQTLHLMPTFGAMGIYTPLLALLYLLAMRSVYSYEKRKGNAQTPEHARTHDALSLRAAVMRFAFFAGIVTLAGFWLPIAGSRIAEEMGWSQTFVGTLLIAGATSLPEVVVTLTAIRMRALDMAIGGLLGSNLFDLLIIAVDDLFYTKGSLLADVSPVHAVTAFSAVMMSGAVIIGLVYRPRQRLLRTMSVVSASLLTLYLVNVYVLFVHRPG